MVEVVTDALSVCVPIELPDQGGGGFRFLANFLAYLDLRGIPWTKDPAAGAPVILLNAWHVGWPTILRAAWARPGVTVVHRVDGAAADYGRDPIVDRAQGRVNRMADLTIFQSEYCRYSTRTKYPVMSHDGPVIHNAVDITVFDPEGPRAPLPAFNGPRVAAVTWSTNPRKGAAAVYRVARSSPDVQFVLAGRFDDAPVASNIVRTGVLDARALSTTLRSCDALVTFSQNEACPNVVLEALATGLPVLYLDSGATGELVGHCGSAMTEATFASELAAVLVRGPELRVAARLRAVERFAPEVVFPRYLGGIAAGLRRDAPGRISRLAELLRRLGGQARPS